ncbi:Na+ dependent nucleoside transporter domain protein [Rhodothermus marinus SG0.5JP17-172]|uniref:NupC/NupG family nucleoside CNT transporter n=1 Tax=Rhodothermus marinus TaxID=29549 RepID=UPI000223D812|nr:nucleoside transporter C-terminal domain-containing protein [Rhodothermus marinus]AEN72338.1 Na+ dependent nucleoside transporter domain protein [Rhodothermus marinus SG0.5JP17-172]MBO2491696.1 NupC/NupG family nucleoside CNT transporter [Rhodothermus marinus]
MSLIALLRGILGLTVILGLAYLLSSDRRHINWRTVGGGLLLQIVLAIFILKGREMGAWFAPLGWPKEFFAWVSSFFVLVLNFTTEGARFVFGNLALSPGIDDSLGFFFAFQVLPTIIFFSSLMAVLYHLGVMQRIVQAVAWVVSRTLGTSGAESLSVSANIFVGQTEAPLVVRPYLEKMTRSELMAVMTGGMATIAGGVMAAYIQLLGDPYAQARGLALEAARLQFAEHLLGASVMAAPAALLLAKMLIPETGQPLTAGTVRVSIERTTRNVIDAAAAGASDGLKLALNVGAMLIAFIALIAMLNYFLGWAGGLVGVELSMEQLFGWTLAPVAWLIGVPWSDAAQFGALVGTKLVVNEFVAYLNLSTLIGQNALSDKAVVMATFALCGFANFSSIAIQIGGIGPLAPSRISELAELGLRAVLAGTLANMMTATIAGVLIG